MNCRKFEPIKCPESGYFGWKLLKYSFVALLLGLILGVPAGYYWCFHQIIPDYEERILRLKVQNQHLMDNWSPVKEYEGRGGRKKK